MTRPVAFQGTTRRLPDIGIDPNCISSYSKLPVVSLDTTAYKLLTIGRPRFADVDPASSGERDFHSSFVRQFANRGEECLKDLCGRFAIAIRSRESGSLTLVVDRFATIPIYYAGHGGDFVFAESAELLPAELRSTDRLAAQSIFNYLYFHTIPSPDSIYTGVSKVPPASYLRLRPGSEETGVYWCPSFDRKDAASFSEQSTTLKTYLKEAIGEFKELPNIGCFLSGGLDSSSVLGYLNEVSGEPARAFTIGFDAPEYDERAFARAAASHFGAELHEYCVAPSDIIDAIRDISTAYDEPFGNSSAVPALCCARFAASHGIQTLLAGDGGDEIFAGNARYAKQKVFDFYQQVPESIRRLLLNPIGSDSSAFSRVPGLGKLASYVRQAQIPLPDRLETYNHLHRFGMKTVFVKSFLGEVDVDRPLELLRDRYRQPETASTLDRMLYLDWKFTLTDNDIRKVSRMCQLAGVGVEFPFLDNNLVEFSTKVPSSRKLRGTYLRYFYRRSMKDFLPPEVLAKRKHGFGLPFGVWLIRDPDLRSFAYDSLSRLESREIIAPGFISSLQTATEQDHAAYFGSMIWVLMMLEEWLAAHH
jgi:asparagine synthase (glutamine-hydrolysing)